MSSEKSEDLQAGDNRTLRLATPEITPEDVEGLITYQRSLRDELEFSPVCHAGWTDMLSSAHQRSLAEAKIDPGRLATVSSVALDFCARRVPVRTLRRRLAELRARIASEDVEGAEPPRPEALDLASRLETEIRRLDDLSPLERRHGKETIAVLSAREDELVTLHEELSPLLHKG